MHLLVLSDASHLVCVLPLCRFRAPRGVTHDGCLRFPPIPSRMRGCPKPASPRVGTGVRRYIGFGVRVLSWRSRALEVSSWPPPLRWALVPWVLSPLVVSCEGSLCCSLVLVSLSPRLCYTLRARRYSCSMPRHPSRRTKDLQCDLGPPFELGCALLVVRVSRVCCAARYATLRARPGTMRPCGLSGTRVTCVTQGTRRGRLSRCQRKRSASVLQWPMMRV